MDPSALTKRVLTVFPWAVYLFAGVLVLLTGKEVPPETKPIFGIATIILAFVSWFALKANANRLRRLRSARTVTLLLMTALVMSGAYTALFKHCVITDPSHGTFYFPMWSTSKLAQAIEEKGSRRQLAAAYGKTTVNNLIASMDWYAPAIAATTFILLILFEMIFLPLLCVFTMYLPLDPRTSRTTKPNEKDENMEVRPIRILFLAANPNDTDSLRLDKEFRAVEEKIRLSDFRDRVELRQQWAVRVNELQGHLLRHRAQIVHFSGHGSASSEIVLEGEDGMSRPVPARALSNLFSILNEDLRCVVLNACYSASQAQGIAQHVDYVVGMSKAISDSAAIAFSASFYQAIGYGETIDRAFDLACNQIDLESLDEQATPKLITFK